MVGHATLLIQAGGLNILTDPVWSQRAGPRGLLGPQRVTAPGIRFDDLPRIDVVLVSHNHYDHFDALTLRRLQALHQPTFVTPLGNGALLARVAPGARVLSGDWGDVAPLAQGISVRLTPAQHWSRRALRDTEIGGVAIPAGADILLLMGSANRDEARFEDGESFDIARPNAREHLSFGFGIHYCLGNMLAKLQAGGSGWDVFVPTNYTISTYVKENLIVPLDMKQIANYDIGSFDPRFAGPGTVDGKVYAVSKNWGTTGFAVNTSKLGKLASPTTWKEFWDMTQAEFSGRTMVHDYQLTTIGNALKYFG
jgi:hypothetical protein